MIPKFIDVYVLPSAVLSGNASEILTSMLNNLKRDLNYYSSRRLYRLDICSNNFPYNLRETHLFGLPGTHTSIPEVNKFGVNDNRLNHAPTQTPDYIDVNQPPYAESILATVSKDTSNLKPKLAMYRLSDGQIGLDVALPLGKEIQLRSVLVLLIGQDDRGLNDQILQSTVLDNEAADGIVNDSMLTMVGKVVRFTFNVPNEGEFNPLRGRFMDIDLGLAEVVERNYTSPNSVANYSTLHLINSRYNRNLHKHNLRLGKLTDYTKNTQINYSPI